MMRPGFLALILSLAVALPGMAFARDDIILINNDSGGNVLQTIANRNRLQASGKEVQIRGYCRSACTIYLSLPNACLGGMAKVGFHAPRLPGTSFIPPIVGDLMGQFYRGEIKRRWYADWQYSLDMQVMTARQYKALDPAMRLCEPGRKKRSK